ncbi:Translation initiation factor 5A (eIF-5A) [Phaffia rhodozyma]|uniref:Translation initiation factor 5A (EIF-5A) n=1 Tax=Phaffia rhodozyma TaxID=264483 RepID=A0A0F7SLX0_PHARH|nr:Translation initiation factor 5A (eIF-5A) [Phaffia rhodozyma]
MPDKAYTLLDISPNQMLTLTDADRNSRSDIPLPDGKIGENIREEFMNGKDLTVTVSVVEGKIRASSFAVN